MQIGYFSVGIGPMADPDVLAITAQTVDQTGFHSLWAPEHIVLIRQSTSKYPYTKDGRFPLPSVQIDLLDPFAALTFAAALTKRVRLGTGVCLVPERNPVVTAKEVASLDKLSGGRFDFGIGVGWLAEEFAAVGVPWERRGQRTREYVHAMKLLWTEDEPEFSGEFCGFPKAVMLPKPVQKPHPPIIVGGTSIPALKRAGEIGDGWYGVEVSVEECREKILRIKEYATAAGRDPDALSFTIAQDMAAPVELDQLKRYRDIGVEQMIVSSSASDPKEIKGSIESLADKVVVPAEKL